MATTESSPFKKIQIQRDDTVSLITFIPITFIFLSFWTTFTVNIHSFYCFCSLYIPFIYKAESSLFLEFHKLNSSLTCLFPSWLDSTNISSEYFVFTAYPKIKVTSFSYPCVVMMDFHHICYLGSSSISSFATKCYLLWQCYICPIICVWQGNCS